MSPLDTLDPRKKSRKPKGDDAPAGDGVAGKGEANEAPRKRRKPSPLESAADALEDDGLAPEMLRAEPVSSRPEKSAAHDPLDDFFYRPDEPSDELLDFTAPEDDAPRAADEALREFLAFRLAGEEYAVGLERVREIVKVPVITEVPRAPQDVLGVMSLRGEVIPVFELRRRLGLPIPSGEPGRSARIVIVDLGEGPVGLIVESVSHVVRLKPSTIEATPPGLGGGAESEYLAGIGRQKHQLYILLNVDAVLARPTIVRERR